MSCSRVFEVCCLAFGIHLACTAASRVEFTDNRLRVDGEPFFFYGCWGTPDGDFAEFRRRHFNTAFLGWRSAVDGGPKASEAGLMVIPYPYAPGWSEAMKAAMASIADEDWVLAWNIGDDLNKPEHIEAALKVQKEIRALDPQKRPVMFDAINRYEEFAKIPDMWCAYAYALVRPAMHAPPARKPTGLQQYGEWLNAMRLLGRDDGLFWTWTQCHVQIWYSAKFLNGTSEDKWRPSCFPDGDHLRLIAAHAISAGCRGFMWFVAWYFQDSHLGRDRYARASIIGCELDVVGSLIAQGRVGARLRTSDPSVWATPIDFPGGRLICLIKTGDFYHYQPDAARVRDVTVDVGVPGRVLQIGADVQELPEATCSFALTNWLLVTEDEGVLEGVRTRHAQVVADMSEFAAEELQARLTKVEPAFQALDGGGDALNVARRCLARAQAARTAGKTSIAIALCDEGLTELRAEQHRAWQRMWYGDLIDVGLRETEMGDFYLLPKMADTVASLRKGAWGVSQLRNGAFEEDAGWGGAKLGHDTSGKVSLVNAAGRGGTRALRLASSSPTIYEGQPQDWVTANVVSDKISAKDGEFVEIAAWVRIPQAFERTSRGVTVALFAYTGEGKRIKGYGAQQLEAPRVEATDGWEQMRLIVPLRSPEIASVAARLAVCGVGEVFIDDVTVRRLEVARP